MPPSRPWILAIAGYLALAVAVTWPLALRLDEAVPGITQVDQMDTAWLRLATARLWTHPWEWPTSTEVFAPPGYPIGVLTPNVLDHWLGAPFALLFPWPVGDNLFWWLLLAANGLAAHACGVRLGGSHAAGALCGVAFALSEPVLREANFHHAPQALQFAAPLFVASLAVAADERDDGAALHAGLLWGLAAVGYWYSGLFLLVLALPIAIELVVRERSGAVRRIGLAVAGGLAVCAFPMILLWLASGDLPDPTQHPQAPPNTTAELARLPLEDQWSFTQGSDPLWPVRRVPLDRTNRVGVALVVAAAIGATRVRGWWRWVAGAAIAGVFVLGPVLKWGEDPVLVGGSLVPLPGGVLADVWFLFARLTWPQRWGIVVPLALLPLAARAPRAGWFALAAGVEAFSVSGNAPLQLTTVGQFDGWRALSAGECVLVVPFDRVGPRAPSLGFAYRAAGRPIASPVDLPPATPPPDAWIAWRRHSPFADWLGMAHRRGPPPGPDVRERLAADGIDVIALDVTPGGTFPRERTDALRAEITEVLGEPVDYGSVVAWWIDPPAGGPPPGLLDGGAWRRAWEARLRDEPPVPYPTLLRPVRWVEPPPYY